MRQIENVCNTDISSHIHMPGTQDTSLCKFKVSIPNVVFAVDINKKTL